AAVDQATERRLIRIGAALAVALVILWLLKQIESVATLVLISFFLAYLLDPLVDRLAAWKLPRSLAAFLVLLAALLLVTLLLVIIVPSIIAEVSKFASVAPQYFETLRDYVAWLMVKLDITVPATWHQLGQALKQGDKSPLGELFGMANPAAKIFRLIFQSTLSIIGFVLYLILVPVLVYYFLVSFDNILDSILDLVPPDTREPVIHKMSQMDQIIADFLRGQFIICLLLAFFYSLGFVIIGIDLALVLGIVSGLLWIIPYVGTGLAIVGGVTMALVNYGDLLHPAYVIIWISLVQVLESYIITPRVVGGKVGVHPIVYIIALIVGAKLFGLLGMLIAIPAAAMIKVLLEDAVTMYKRSQLYQNPEGDGEHD
ncbi:MAG: AI-2E family transporter, partial [Thermodesulfobacteriota bacterium]